MNKKCICIVLIMAFISIINTVKADEQLMWTSKLHKDINPFSNYELINNSDPETIEKNGSETLEVFEKMLGKIINDSKNNNKVNSKIEVTNLQASKVIADASLKTPDSEEVRISTTFGKNTFSIESSTITGLGERNKLLIKETKNNKGIPIRYLNESLSSIQTELFDNSAPVVDIVSFIYLMAGQNKDKAKQIDKKPLYFYFNGLVRKLSLQTENDEQIDWQGKQRKAIKVNLIQESKYKNSKVGSIWIDATGNGEPLKIKIGLLNFTIKTIKD